MAEIVPHPGSPVLIMTDARVAESLRLAKIVAQAINDAIDVVKPDEPEKIAALMDSTAALTRLLGILAARQSFPEDDHEV